ncbi:hypothetical protein GCM10023188_05270 [Pontibacter saemangeumensis]|uniref:Uncharacterized protein n=1 Tax=Pontibacter saemangeumensis TaxID=1084525 RepID=A0ABP8LAW2_9BACT
MHSNPAIQKDRKGFCLYKPDRLVLGVSAICTSLVNASENGEAAIDGYKKSPLSKICLKKTNLKDPETAVIYHINT